MRNISSYIVIAVLLSVFVAGCKKSSQDLGRVLFREFRNPALKEITPAAVAPFLEKKLGENKTETGELLAAYYRKQRYAPLLVKRYLPEDGMETLLERLESAGEHGLNPGLFQPERLRKLLDTLENEEAVFAPDAASPLIAELELQLANSLAAYSNALQFGLTNPAEIYPRYYIETRRPDSASTARLFTAGDLKAYLDSIQPSGSEYKALQKALAGLATGPVTNAAGPTRTEATVITGTGATGTTAARPAANIRRSTGQPIPADSSREAFRRTLAVNLERLRWKNKPAEEKYVLVNIADFRLHVVENDKSVLDMRVCVGEPARRWQTPQLNSLIERVQVNPVWNIPKSIASREIIKHAAADPYYLENANIDVYKDGKRIEDSREINWSKVSGEKMPYTFKQRPGSQNALGKIKFLFDNQSSVYLHDTPAKAAFDMEMRAISHGCVRVEKPVDLALALFGRGSKFEQIKTEMGKENPEARNIELPEEVPVYLMYYTCWPGENGDLQVREDVYGLDSIVFSHLQREKK